MLTHVIKCFDGVSDWLTALGVIEDHWAIQEVVLQVRLHFLRIADVVRVVRHSD